MMLLKKKQTKKIKQKPLPCISEKSALILWLFIHLTNINWAHTIHQGLWSALVQNDGDVFSVFKNSRP